VKVVKVASDHADADTGSLAAAAVAAFFNTVLLLGVPR
jgi:hypothetical protein